MLEIEKPKIETVEIDSNAKYGKFVVEPLERGYGTTLGNSLRRILLSSLPGAAVTSIQIDGVLHEFSTVEGVEEDVASIILNIKKLALKIYSDEEKVIEIDVKGDGTVTAADITHDSDVEILNPDLYIATIAKDGHLRMRMYANRGRGYARADQNKREDLPIGVIPIDSIYTPVSRVVNGCIATQNDTLSFDSHLNHHHFQGDIAMTDSTSHTGAASGGLNDVLRIRDIIFGEQMAQYETRFGEHTARLQDLQTQIQSLEAHVQQQHDAAMGSTQQQLEALKSMLLARIDALAHEKTARADLGAMLIDLGERLRQD